MGGGRVLKERFHILFELTNPWDRNRAFPFAMKKKKRFLTSVRNDSSARVAEGFAHFDGLGVNGLGCGMAGGDEGKERVKEEIA